MKANLAPLTTALIISTFYVQPVSADDHEALFDMSLENLLKVEVVTPTKEKSSILSSLSSTSVITQEMILSSGASSIPEALRLAPGVIVREQTPGNYDIHIRGLDYIPPGSIILDSSNSIALVMIDNRIVYNYFSGGTFWEALPVDIVDIDRIEVVRGPSAALHGPNAVGGVIHIITANKPANQAVVNLGPDNYKKAQATQSLQVGNTSITLSGNYHERDRHQADYYEYSGDRRVTNPADIVTINPGGAISNPTTRYPTPEKSLDRRAYNLTVKHEFNESSKGIVRAGGENSYAQRVYSDIDATPLTTLESETHYIQLQGEMNSHRFNFSYDHGEQSTLGVAQFTYDLDHLDMNYDYQLELAGFKILPGVGFRKIQYNGVFLGEEKTLNIYSGYIQLQKELLGLDILASWRGDKYEIKDDPITSYQFAIGKEISSTLFARLNYSKANRSPFLLNTFANFDFEIPAFSKILRIQGNKNTNPMENHLIEMGVRKELKNSFIDFELFYQTAEDYDAVSANGVTFTEGSNTVDIYKYDNLAVKAKQVGATIYHGMNWSKFFRSTLHFTLQETKLENHYTTARTASSAVDRIHHYTPTYYGGLSLDYHLNDKTKLNFSQYFLASQKAQQQHDSSKVPSKLVSNMNISYELISDLVANLSARNLFDDNKVEYALADAIGAQYSLGIHYKW